MIITKDNYIWYSPSEIRYERYQNIWLIACVLRLPEGEWPLEPSTVGESQHSKPKHAPYEGACDVMGELKLRLKTTGEAGETLLCEIQSYYDFEERGRIIPYEALTEPARRALNYLSRNKRRKQTYPEWRYEKDGRKKIKNRIYSVNKDFYLTDRKRCARVFTDSKNYAWSSR